MLQKNRQKKNRWKQYNLMSYFGGVLSCFYSSLIFSKEISSYFQISNSFDVACGFLILGSFLLLISEITQWHNYRISKVIPLLLQSNNNVQKLDLAQVLIIYIVLVFGRYLFLTAAIIYHPTLSYTSEAYLIFVISSVLIYASSLWKVGKYFFKVDQTQTILIKNIKNIKGCLSDFFCGLSMFLFFLGTIYYQYKAVDPLLDQEASRLWIIGALLGLISSIIKLSNYFWQVNDQFTQVQSQQK